MYSSLREWTGLGHVPWKMPIAKLCDIILTSTSDNQAWVHSIACYRQPTGVRHEYLVIKVAVYDGRYQWIRLERATLNAKNSFQIFSNSSTLTPKDEATVASTGDIARDGEKVQHLDLSHQSPSLHTLARLLDIFCEEAPWYTALSQLSLKTSPIGSTSE
ncbi:hypothetical protein FRC09_020790 [Ceratobasidium sp. 395]|nr:hypothetical protein FRC09_020790 [Ceratobasidium sp. 395]